MSQLEIKPSLEAFRLAEIAVKEEISGEESNAPLKEAWIKLGNQLEIEGIPKEKIATTAGYLILRKKSEKLKIDIKELRLTGYFHRVFKEHGWTDPFYSHTKEDADALGRRDNSSPKNEFEIENKDWIDVMDRYIDLFKDARDLMKCESWNDLIPDAISKESLFLLNRNADMQAERQNKKRKIPLSHYSVLFRDCLVASSATVSTLFYEHIRKRGKFTGKQARKIIHGLVKDMPDKYEPKDFEESESLGFSGESCPQCNHYRTEITMRVEKTEENGESILKGVRQLHCYKCDRAYDAPKINMPATMVSDAEWA